LPTAGETERAIFIGRAQEKVNVFATTGHRGTEEETWRWVVRESPVVAHRTYDHGIGHGHGMQTEPTYANM